MKASTAIGIGVAIVGLLFGAMMEGSQISAFIDPPAILIVFGGTFGDARGDLDGVGQTDPVALQEGDVDPTP